MRLSFRGQVLLLFAALFLAGWVGASALLSDRLRDASEGNLVRYARSLAANLARWSADLALTEDSVDLLRLLEQTKQANRDVVYVYVRKPDGHIVASTLGRPFPSALAAATAGRDLTRLRTERGALLDVRATIREARGGEIHVGYSRSALEAGAGRIQGTLWLIAVPVLLIGLLGLWALSGYVTRPARDLAQAVRRFGAGDLSARVPERGIAEMSVLARAFNQMAAAREEQAARLAYLSEYNRRLIDNLGAALYVVNEDWRLEFANRELALDEARLGRRSCHEILYGRSTVCEACPAGAARETGRPSGGTRAGPGGRVYEETAIPLHDPRSDRTAVVVVRRDVTDAAEFRRERARTEKLAAVGELAAAVAHEVNNPLDGMRSLLRLVEADPGTNQDAREMIDLVQGGITRIEMCVRRLLTIAADAPRPRSVGSMRRFVRDALALAGPTLDRIGVEVDLDLGANLPGVVADPHRFAQLVLSLLLMAADGVPRGGRVSIRAEPDQGGGVCTTFGASGPSAAEQGHHTFLPFFVARDPEHGSALGLVVSQRIAEEHGGRVEAREADDGSMTYVLVLPPASAAPDPETEA